MNAKTRLGIPVVYFSRVVGLAAVAGFVGMFLLDALTGKEMFLAVLPLAVIASVVTWVVLFPMVYCKGVFGTLVVGALSPFVAGVLMLPVLIGVYILGYMWQTMYASVPIGMATAVMFRLSCPCLGWGEREAKRD